MELYSFYMIKSYRNSRSINHYVIYRCTQTAIRIEQ